MEKNSGNKPKTEEQLDEEYYSSQLQELGDTSENLKQIAWEIRRIVKLLEEYSSREYAKEVRSANFSIPLFIKTLPEIQEDSLKISDSLMSLQKSEGDDDFKHHLLHEAIRVNKELIELLSNIINKFFQFILTHDIKSLGNYEENVFMIQQTSKQLRELEKFVKIYTINQHSTSKGGKSRRRRHRRSPRSANKKSRKERKSRTQRMKNRRSGRSKRGGLIESPNKKRIKAILGFNDPNFDFSDVNAVLTPEKMNEIYDNVWKDLEPVQKFVLVDEFKRGLPHGQLFGTTHLNRRPLYNEMCQRLRQMDIDNGVLDQKYPWEDIKLFGPRRRIIVHPFPYTDTPVSDQRLPGIEPEETETDTGASAQLLTPSGGKSRRRRRRSHRRSNKKSRKVRKVRKSRRGHRVRHGARRI